MSDFLPAGDWQPDDPDETRETLELHWRQIEVQQQQINKILDAMIDMNKRQEAFFNSLNLQGDHQEFVLQSLLQNHQHITAVANLVRVLAAKK